MLRLIISLFKGTEAPSEVPLRRLILAGTPDRVDRAVINEWLAK